MSEFPSTNSEEQVRLNKLNELQYLTHEKIAQKLGSKHLADLVTEKPKCIPTLNPIKLFQEPGKESDGYSQSGSHTVNGVTRDWLTEVTHFLDGENWSIKTFWESKNLFQGDPGIKERLWTYPGSGDEILVEGQLSIENLLQIILERAQNTKVSSTYSAVALGGLGELSEERTKLGGKERVISVRFSSKSERSYATFHLSV
jgi:hypothetical protein